MAAVHFYRSFFACMLLCNALLVSGQVVASIAGTTSSSYTLDKVSDHTNLIPNPSFEDFRVRPLGWYYKGANYNRVMRYWSSPTSASPDAYNPEVRVPAHWAGKGFGGQVAHSGGAMTGLTLYGCANGKPHCREYVQSQLIEPLVAGQRYRFSLYVSALPRGLRIDQVAAAFTPQVERFDDDRRLELTPQVRFGELTGGDERWREVSGEFVATGGEAYVILGNFSDDATTGTETARQQPALPFAYYYIDDVSLRKVSPIVPVVAAPDDLSRRVLEAGASFELRHVYFDHDSDELEPRSFVELDKLTYLLTAYPSARLRIVGYTDAAGADDYNEDLSRRRAATVVRYLVEAGIGANRLASEGRGRREAVADNGTEAGRAKNRRVVAMVE